MSRSGEDTVKVYGDIKYNKGRGKMTLCRLLFRMLMRMTVIINCRPKGKIK